MFNLIKRAYFFSVRGWSARNVFDRIPETLLYCYEEIG